MSASRNQKPTQSNFNSDSNTISTVTTTSKPPRPMNCFLLYRREKQKEILAQCPGANHRDISKIIAKWWRQATSEEKEPYVKKAALEKIKHAHQYPAYKFMPQKKSKIGTRTYKRRTQDEFTSKSKELNDCMKIMYHAGDASAAPAATDAKLANNTPPATSPSVSMPSINADVVSSLLVPLMNNSAPVMNMSSPSSSSLSSSPSSLSSPYYHPCVYPDTDIYFQKDAMAATVSFLSNGNGFSDCAFYAGSQSMESNSDVDPIQMNAFYLNQYCSNDVTNLYVPDDCFYQPSLSLAQQQQQQQELSSLFPTSLPSYPNMYSNFTVFADPAYPDIQDYPIQYIDGSLSPSDFYIETSLPNQNLKFDPTCSPNSL